MRISFVLLLAFFSLTSCYVSRCVYPKVSGYVYDAETRRALPFCSVNGMPADSNGYYEFPEYRRREFTFIGFEAPPVRVDLYFSMDGFQNDTIVAKNRYGGALPVGAHWRMDTIFLEKN